MVDLLGREIIDGEDAIINTAFPSFGHVSEGRVGDHDIKLPVRGIVGQRIALGNRRPFRAIDALKRSHPIRVQFVGSDIAGLSLDQQHPVASRRLIDLIGAGDAGKARSNIGKRSRRAVCLIADTGRGALSQLIGR